MDPEVEMAAEKPDAQRQPARVSLGELEVREQDARGGDGGDGAGPPDKVKLSLAGITIET